MSAATPVDPDRDRDTGADRPESFDTWRDTAIARYADLGISARQWARGKLRGDPGYPAVVSRLPERGRLLDLGCGEGYLLALVRAARPELELVGVDHDERRLAQARRALDGEPNLALHAGDLRAHDLPDADAIVCLDVLHYLPIPEQDAALDRAVAALRPGGCLLVRDAEPSRGWRSRATVAAERLARIVGRHRGQTLAFRSMDEAAARCRAAGCAAEVVPCSEGTPFSNRLLVAHRPEA